MFYVLMYLAEVLPSISILLGSLGGVLLVIALFYGIISNCDKDFIFKKSIFYPIFIFGLMGAMIGVSIPTTNAIYKIAIGGYVLENGSKALTTLAESDIPSDMKDIVTMEIKKYKNNLTAEFKKTESDSL